MGIISHNFGIYELKSAYPSILVIYPKLSLDIYHLVELLIIFYFLKLNLMACYLNLSIFSNSNLFLINSSGTLNFLASFGIEFKDFLSPSSSKISFNFSSGIKK